MLKQRITYVQSWTFTCEQTQHMGKKCYFRNMPKVLIFGSLHWKVTKKRNFKDGLGTRLLFSPTY